jgi:hypothetical protein
MGEERFFDLSALVAKSKGGPFLRKGPLGMQGFGRGESKNHYRRFAPQFLFL